MKKVYTCFQCGKIFEEMVNCNNCIFCHSKNISMKKVITKEEEIVYAEYRRKTDLSDGDGMPEPLSMQKSYNHYMKENINDKGYFGHSDHRKDLRERLSKCEEIKRNVPFLKDAMDYLLEDMP